MARRDANGGSRAEPKIDVKGIRHRLHRWCVSSICESYSRTDTCESADHEGVFILLRSRRSVLARVGVQGSAGVSSDMGMSLVIDESANWRNRSLSRNSGLADTQVDSTCSGPKRPSAILRLLLSLLGLLLALILRLTIFACASA